MDSPANSLQSAAEGLGVAKRVMQGSQGGGAKRPVRSSLVSAKSALVADLVDRWPELAADARECPPSRAGVRLRDGYRRSNGAT